MLQRKRKQEGKRIGRAGFTAKATTEGSQEGGEGESPVEGGLCTQAAGAVSPKA